MGGETWLRTKRLLRHETFLLQFSLLLSQVVQVGPGFESNRGIRGRRVDVAGLAYSVLHRLSA
ncbi:hypothetical protein M758_11G128100 [Ceratodon purpureus]|uniref:Uncharacterized protein n=1 Tax=Ceratodon purpureus TaxID=3225 RepID=A0A8T0HTP0_CERPU|nr:hypothetical protein KC19_VG259400 [Ceratodon purpureus]KAG0596694.1 hypothetical protein M758_UG277000 [Ceratodon purpureus]KAG0601637.1 hypothetical protein M758_11G128100 [Ceratodon purpureus]